MGGGRSVINTHPLGFVAVQNGLEPVQRVEFLVLIKQLENVRHTYTKYITTSIQPMISGLRNTNSSGPQTIVARHSGLCLKEIKDPPHYYYNQTYKKSHENVRARFDSHGLTVA